jgi:hypothetical protein
MAEQLEYNSIAERAGYRENHQQLAYERQRSPEFLRRLAITYVEDFLGINSEAGTPSKVNVYLATLPFVKNASHMKMVKAVGIDYEDSDSIQEFKEQFVYPDGVGMMDARNSITGLAGDREGLIEYFSEQLAKLVEFVNSRVILLPEIAENESRRGGSAAGLVAAVGNSHEYANIEKDIVVAHEIGHTLRNYDPEYVVGRKITELMDVSGFALHPSLQAKVQSYYNKPDAIGTFHEEFERLKMYFSSPNEFVERCAQLKNYFGLKQGEEFTVEHFDYARENYGKDYGEFWDHDMYAFFSLISDTKKDQVVSFINKFPL